MVLLEGVEGGSVKLAIVGSRGFSNLEKVHKVLSWYRANYPISHIISGGARGIDQEARYFAMMERFPLVEFRVDNVPPMGTYQTLCWNQGAQESRHVGPKFYDFPTCAFYRNSLIVEAADKVIAFWDGGSSGTWDDIEKALGQKPLTMTGSKAGTYIRRDLEVVFA